MCCESRLNISKILADKLYEAYGLDEIKYSTFTIDDDGYIGVFSCNPIYKTHDDDKSTWCCKYMCDCSENTGLIISDRDKFKIDSKNLLFTYEELIFRGNVKK